MPYSNNNCTRPGQCQCPACRARNQACQPEQFSAGMPTGMPVGMPVGMAYVPWQAFGEPFAPEVGMAHGTLFPDLSLPFLCVNPACGNRPRSMGMQQNMRGGRR